jgi:hypothetical protein
VNGQLANVIALALHGSAWLADPTADVPDLERSNSTFQYVRRTRFELPPSRWRRRSASVGSREWLSSLRANGTTRLWLVIPEATPGPVEPHHAAGFSNGGRWGLLATGGRPTSWFPDWDVHDLHAADNRIWDVRFVGSRADDGAPPDRPPSAASLTDLVSALVAIREFARDHGLDFWAERFDVAIGHAGADSPEIPFHPDLAPPSTLSAEARRLLAAGSQAWVFGGMGSWNDLGLDDPSAADPYQQVSRELYARMLTAFVSATNADPQAPQRSR